MSASIDEELARISEAYSKERLEELKKSVPRDAEVIWECAKRIINEYAYLVESAIINGVMGDEDESVLHHKLSGNCAQMVGAMIELARGEGINEHYLSARKKTPPSLHESRAGEWKEAFRP